MLRVARGLRRLTHTLPPQPHIDCCPPQLSPRLFASPPRAASPKFSPGSSASPPCRPLAAAPPPSPPLRFFTLFLHLQSGVPAHYARAPEHVYASLARTRASPLARPSPLCHAQLSLTSDLTPCSPLTRTFSLLCAVWRFSWVGGWNREFGGPTPRSPSSVKYGPYSGSDAQGSKPRFCG